MISDGGDSLPPAAVHASVTAAAGLAEGLWLLLLRNATAAGTEEG